MSIDLMKLAKSTLGSNALKLIAGKLGEDEQKTGRAVDLAGSAILGSLMKEVSTPSGANALLREVQDFDAGMLGNLPEMLTGGSGGQQNSSWNQLGSNLVGRLLGGKMNSLASSIGKLAGIGEGSSKSLLTMLAPLLLGLIAKQFRSGNLNLKGLVDLIMGQKSVVAKSLPPQLCDELGVAGLLDESANVGQVTPGTVAPKPADDPVNPLLKVLVPLAVLVAVGYMGWYFFLKPADDVAQNNAGVVETNDDTRTDRLTVNKPVIPGFDFDTDSGELTQSLGALSKSISGITDAASARSVVPQIADIQKLIDGYGLDKLPVGPMSKVRDLLSPLVEKLQAALKTAYALPGVKPILEPAMEPLMKTMTGLAKS